MASKAGIALFFSFNLLFFALVSSHNVKYRPSQDGQNNPDDSSNGVGDNSNGGNGGNSNGSPNGNQQDNGNGLLDLFNPSNGNGGNPSNGGSGLDLFNLFPFLNPSNQNGNGGNNLFNPFPLLNPSNGVVGNLFNLLPLLNPSNGNGNANNLPTNFGLPATILPLPAGTTPSGLNNQQGGGQSQGQGQGQGQGPRGSCRLLNLGVCANLLNGVVNAEVGNVPTKPCCTLIQGLADLEAALCLCTAIRARVLGLIDLNLSISLTVLLNNCGRQVPSDFQCRLN